GLPHAELADCPRPTAALADVRKVANDFVILRTLPRGLAQVLDRLEPALKHSCASPRLFVQCKSGALILFDQDLRPCVELAVDASRGFITRAGVEWPRAGLRLFNTSEPEA